MYHRRIIYVRFKRGVDFSHFSGETRLFFGFRELEAFCNMSDQQYHRDRGNLEQLEEQTHCDSDVQFKPSKQVKAGQEREIMMLPSDGKPHAGSAIDVLLPFILQKLEDSTNEEESSPISSL